MTDDEKKTIKRLSELSSRAETRGISAYSEFLTLSEQALLPQADCAGAYSLFGGWENAERRVACFGEDAEAAVPIDCIRISPLSAKFAEELGHRDYLGALMSLGVRREVLGDIVLSEGYAYLFCLDSISDFIISELTQIRRTSVRCKKVDSLPDAAIPQPEEREVVVSSIRLDALVSAVWNLSRSDGQELISQGKVFVNGKEITSAAFSPAEDDIISVRGHGRFQYCGVERETKKGRIRIAVKVY